MCERANFLISVLFCQKRDDILLKRVRTAVTRNSARTRLIVTEHFLYYFNQNSLQLYYNATLCSFVSFQCYSLQILFTLHNDNVEKQNNLLRKVNNQSHNY